MTRIIDALGDWGLQFASGIWLVFGLLMPVMALGVWVWMRRRRQVTLAFDHSERGKGRVWWTVFLANACAELCVVQQPGKRGILG